MESGNQPKQAAMAPPPSRADADKRPAQEQSDRYHSYLLRVWSDPPDATWYFTLESVDTGERVAFHNLEELFSFLDRVTTPQL